MFLPDINVWIALAFDNHFHHEIARAWFESSNEMACFCRMSQQGFLRLSTNPSVMKDDVLSLNQAWEMYDTILEDSRVTLASEPRELERFWRESTQRKTFSPKIWNDAYLAAFAVARDYQLVTFDAGFLQLKNLRCKVLS